MSESGSQSAFDRYQDDLFKADFETAVRTTLGDMFATKVEAAFDSIDGAVSIDGGEIFASVGLIHDDVIGSVIVSFPHATLAGVLRNLYKRDLPAGGPSLVEGSGEIANIVSGVMKDRLRKRGIAFKTTLPQVTLASTMRIPSAYWSLRGKFTSDAGSFEAFVVLQPVS